MSDGPRLPRLFGAGQWERLVDDALRRSCHVCGAKAGVPCRRGVMVDGALDFPEDRPRRDSPHRSRMIP